MNLIYFSLLYRIVFLKILNVVVQNLLIYYMTQGFPNRYPQNLHLMGRETFLTLI